MMTIGRTASPAGFFRISPQPHKHVAPLCRPKETHATFNHVNTARKMAGRPVALWVLHKKQGEEGERNTCV